MSKKNEIEILEAIKATSAELQKRLEAALGDEGISLETLRQNVCSAAADLPMFKTDADKPYSPWVRDILAPEEGNTWCAIIGGPDSKIYEIDFTVTDGKPSITGEPREVVQEVTYVTASMEQPRKSGKFHGAAAATDEAYEASKDAKTKHDHLSAAVLHDNAAELHKAAGNDAMAKQHKEKAVDHRETAAAMDAPATTAAAPATPHSALRTPQLFALEGAMLVDAPTTASAWDNFMAMAGGVQTMTLGCEGYPVTVTIDVNKAGAQALQAQLETIQSKSKQRPFNCFDHGGSKGRTEASSWPKKFFWKGGDKPGIYEAAEPSDAGTTAIKGKRYRGFSLTFYTDAQITPVPKSRGGGFEIKAGAIGSPEKPAQIICPDEVGENPERYLNMGTLTNKPASVNNEPLFASQPDGRAQANSPSASGEAAARNAGASSTAKPKPKSTMLKEPKQLDAAALQERCDQLEAKITELSDKKDADTRHELAAAEAELEAAQTKLELAKEQEKTKKLEAAETKRTEDQADEAVRQMISSQQIPRMDKEMQASWRDKFVKDPALIPLVVKKPTGGRITPGATSIELTAGSRIEGGFSVPDAMKAFSRILMANAAIKIHRGMTKGQMEEAYEQKGRLALEAGLFYKKNLAKNRDEWESIPGDALARAIGLEAAQVERPNVRQLEAGDYNDPNNQFGILNGTLVLQRTLPLFAYEYPELMAMYTDFSDTPGLLNQTENTHIVIVPAVQKYNTALDANGRPIGFQVASPAQVTDAPLTLTDYIAVPIVIGQNILSSTVRRLFDEQSEAGIKAIAGYFTGMVSKLLTPANFNAYAAVTAPDANGVQTVPVAYTTYAKGINDWSMVDLDKLSAIFTQNKVPRGNRGILLNTNYYAKLRNDPRLEFFFAASKGDPVLTQQKLPDGLSGFFPYEAPYLPQTNNLAFFPFHKAGIILKSRLPMDFTQAVSAMIPGSVTTVTDPDTKISVALVQRVDLIGNYAEWRPEVQLGANVGDNRGGLCGTTQ